MNRVTLGNTTLSVYPVCLGGNVFGWTADESQSLSVLDTYADAGGNFVDTADAYGSWVPTNPPGASELIIGKWLNGRTDRAEQVIATKVGALPEHGGLSARNIMQCADDSLARLGTDHIDLYYAHFDDPSVDLEETLTAFSDLIKLGKVRYIAASNYSAARLAEAMTVSQEHGLASYCALQTHYNMMERAGFEDELMGACADLNIPSLPYYSLASGFLSGKYSKDGRDNNGVRAETARSYLDKGGEAVLDALMQVAQAHAVSMAAVALAWLAQRPTVAAPIASARNTTQLTELLQMPDVKLTAEQMDLLTATAPR